MQLPTEARGRQNPPSPGMGIPMDHEAPQSVTFWLARAGDGDARGFQQAYAAAYEELKRLAHSQLRRRGRAVETTVLVNEAYLKLCTDKATPANDRHHLMGLACSAMRQVLSNLARDAGAGKRDGVMVTLATGLGDQARPLEDLIAFDDSLSRLAKIDERCARMVELRYFGGYNEEETAAILGVTDRTLRRDWRKAQAFLQMELGA